MIDEVSGDIAVTGSLDRESPGGSGHLLVVQAFDDVFNIDIPVTINVIDVNDNPPHFLMESYSVNISELLPEGSFVLAVSATDQDLGDNGRIRYQLKALASMFNLDSETGHLTIGQVLGYQKPENMFAANPIRFKWTSLPSTMAFLRSGTPSGVNVIQVEAHDDLDEGSNAEVHYFIINGNGTSRFEVDQETGWVRVLGNTLEGSIGTRYSLEIQAQDKGRPTRLSSTTFVELVITAANIHSPQFSQSSLTASVSEDQTTGIVATLHATDQDLGINGQVTYSITSGNEMQLFSVDPSSGEIYLEGELDYEMQTSHMLEITASDGAWETLSTTASLVVNVEDVDDNPPIFQQRDYFVTVPENTASAEYVTQVIAVDADSDRFAQFTYAIIGGSGENFFTLDENSGVVRTQGNLDYEQGLLEYQVTIIATNNDGSQRDTAHLHVEITGVNEFSPRFLQTEYEFTVSEGAPDGALVGSVLALDSDSGTDGKVLYLLIGASNDVGFTINAETGQLIVSKENGILDREMTDEVILSVLAKNEGPLTGSNIDEATVTVHIIDANDAPVFDSEQYIASVREDADPQTYITTVTAEEKDQNPAFRQFIYTFRENSHYDLFDINAVTGRITLRGTLDRETTAVYNIAVAAVDSGTPPMTGTAEVIVTVEDVNDNGPVLLGSNAVGTVRENQPENTVVMTLNATDPDSGSNPASFRYRLSPLSDAFTLNFVTGELRTSKRLNREDQLDHYLQVEITDGGSPLMAATSTLRIIVEDENDQLSASRHARIEVKMYQSSFPGGPLGTVKPIDNDLGDTFDCDISSGDQSKFRIESDCILHAEAHSSVIQYTVNVSGSDGVHPSVLSSFTVSFQDYYDATLDASITIQLSAVSAEEFLTFHYDKLLAAMSSILSSREEVIVLSLTDIDDSDLNVLLAVKSGNGHMSKDGGGQIVSGQQS
ncbi:putative protocadherin Fat 4 [Apostichopus japonicus]|uniref:Putative protocadherin Fat 4 n=1 Tax=Stichopus japonicus TaxID=307972 RepID=A0A2G8KVC7_STIJA|nr:putative protocadherin Fat 4 [Apostichopus japonicus]